MYMDAGGPSSNGDTSSEEDSYASLSPQHPRRGCSLSSRRSASAGAASQPAAVTARRRSSQPARSSSSSSKAAAAAETEEEEEAEEEEQAAAGGRDPRLVIDARSYVQEEAEEEPPAGPNGQPDLQAGIVLRCRAVEFPPGEFPPATLRLADGSLLRVPFAARQAAGTLLVSAGSAWVTASAADCGRHVGMTACRWKLG